jgi:hypothetical protein
MKEQSVCVLGSYSTLINYRLEWGQFLAYYRLMQEQIVSAKC